VDKPNWLWKTRGCI